MPTYIKKLPTSAAAYSLHRIPQGGGPVGFLSGIPEEKRHSRSIRARKSKKAVSILETSWIQGQKKPRKLLMGTQRVGAQYLH
jgi:hypothetical protein